MYNKIISIILAVCFTALPCTAVNAESENTTITRAELADAVMEIHEYITQTFSLPMPEQPVFSDIKESPFQFRIIQAYTEGFMYGAGDGQFLPDENVMKAQMAVVLYRLVQNLNKKYNTSQEEKTVDILNIEMAPAWEKQAVNFMVSTDLMPFSENYFYLNEPVSESELYETAKKIADIFAVFHEGERIDFKTFLNRVNNGGK